jgi:hypothetical protein
VLLNDRTIRPEKGQFRIGGRRAGAGMTTGEVAVEQAVSRDGRGSPARP